MARPTTIADDRILKAARELFLKRGLRATTAEIAEQAQVSQGILFKRFKSKQALFQAAMAIEAEPKPASPLDLVARVGKGSVEETLVEWGVSLIEAFLDFLPTAMMAWSNKQEDESDRRSVRLGKHPEKALVRMRTLAAYLAAEAELGRVRHGDFEVVSQIFIGAFWHYAFLQVTLGDKDRPREQHHAFSVGVVDTLWTGIAPRRVPKRRS